VRFIIAQVVEKFGFDGVMWIGSINTVHIGPDDELFGIDHVGNDGAGKIGAISAERGDAAVGGGADEAGDDRDEASIEKREEDVAAAFFSLLQIRFGVAERVAGEYEIGRGNGNGGDTGFLESGGEETGAEALAKGSETIGEFRGGNDPPLERHFVEKIAAEKLEAAADAVVLLFAKLKILQRIEVEMDYAFGFIARVGQLAIGKRARDGEQAVRDALHGGDHDDDAGILGSHADEAGSV
jgi:hypothetical protein